MTIEDQNISTEIQQPINEDVVNDDTEVANESKEVNDNEEVSEVKADEELIEPTDTKNVAKRIGKLSKKLADQSAEIEYWKQQAIGKHQQTEQVEQPRQQNDDNDGRPRMSDYNDSEEYIDALTSWKLEQREKQAEQTRLENNRKDAYYAKVQEFEKSAPDFALAVGEITGIIGSDNNMLEFILDSDIGPAVAYNLANNQDELNRIMKMSPVRRIAALTKIESELSSRKQSTSSVAKKEAPAPATRMTGNTGSSISASQNVKPEGSDFASWKKWRDANRKKK